MLERGNAATSQMYTPGLKKIADFKKLRQKVAMIKYLKQESRLEQE